MNHKVISVYVRKNKCHFGLVVNSSCLLLSQNFKPKMAGTYKNLNYILNTCLAGL